MFFDNVDSTTLIATNQQIVNSEKFSNIQTLCQSRTK